MTISQLEDFRVRSQEVRAFLDEIVRRHSENPHGRIEQAAMDRSAALLFIYNLIESGARSIGEAVFDAVETERIDFDKLSTELRRELFKLLKRRNPKDLAEGISRIGHDIYRFAYDPKAVLSGNVDRRKWSERLVELGCPGNLPPDPERLILRIKGRRNDLAHGHLGFAAGGRDFTLEELSSAHTLAHQMGERAFREVYDLISSGKHRAAAS